MDESIERHVEQVMAWLEENVQVFLEPEAVTLSEFSVNWEDFSGDFNLSLDDVMLSRKVGFGLEASGKTRFYMPMFYSPLGAPASYAAIEITEKTRQAILTGLRQTFPHGQRGRRQMKMVLIDLRPHFLPFFGGGWSNNVLTL